jgi:hypothetical protein
MVKIYPKCKQCEKDGWVGCCVCGKVAEAKLADLIEAERIANHRFMFATSSEKLAPLYKKQTEARETLAEYREKMKEWKVIKK